MFDKPGSYRQITLEARSDICHLGHILEPQNQIRKEQPEERFTALCAQEVLARKQTMTPKKVVDGAGGAKGELPTLEQVELRVQAVIDAREKNESAVLDGGKLGEADVAGMENALVELQDEAEPAMIQSGQAKKKSRPSRPAAAKAKAGTARAKQGATPVGNPTELPAAPVEIDQRSVMSPVDDASSQGGDSLLAAITAKLGTTDMKSVRNLRPDKILAGDALGRSLQGAPWLPFIVTVCALPCYERHIVHHGVWYGQIICA